MKICLYTISDLQKGSIECIDMLYDSIFSQSENKINIDFYVITNNTKIPSNFHYNVILSEYSNYHIVYSRYTNRLPANYNKYIYFDSDILCFDDIKSLITDSNYAIVTEKLLMTDQWFRYPFATIQDYIIMKEIKGINSGTFIFSNKEDISSISDLFIPYLDKYQSKDGVSNAQFEQSCFNYFILKKCGKYFNNCQILSNKIELDSSNIKPSLSKKIYHFTNFFYGMQKKANFMKQFKEAYERDIICKK
jgi:hypothetical protein